MTASAITAANVRAGVARELRALAMMGREGPDLFARKLDHDRAEAALIG